MCMCTAPCGDFPSFAADGVVCCPDGPGMAAASNNLSATPQKEIKDMFLTPRPAGGGQGEPEPCMLVPAYPPHFKLLNIRILMTSRLNVGRLVKTVVVFGTDEERERFCTLYQLSCSAEVGFLGISLEGLLGKYKHDQLLMRLGMKRGPSTHFVGDRRGCWEKSGGRVYQTVKKFMGSAFGPPECSIFWVTDAESIPFRKHDLHKLLEANAKEPGAVLSHWVNEERCSNYACDDGTDESCATLLSEEANGLRFLTDKQPTQFTRQRWEKGFWFFDQWWMYEPQATRMYLDMLNSTMHREAWDWISYYGFSDSSMYYPMMEWAASYGKTSKIQIRNLRDAIRNRFPEAFSHCCACKRKGGKICAPCGSIVDLFSGCMNSVPLKDRLKLLWEDLRVFGSGNYIRFMYTGDALKVPYTDDLPGIVWCYNNCFRTDAFGRMMTAPGSDQEGLRYFESQFKRPQA